jgi:hypothetical protein
MHISALTRLTRGSVLAVLLAAGVSVAAQPSALGVRPAIAAPVPALPEKLSDAEFWALVSDISEPGGYFRITDNYTSNEGEIGRIFTMIRQSGPKGGVYIGVGPEQNLTYIAAVRPAMAFIIDIRRQAVVQHLMFKAMFELSKDRADFISMLFSKPRPPGLDATTPIQKLWEAFLATPTDQATAVKNALKVTEHLTKTHKFTLNADELDQLSKLLQAFVGYGPGISTRGSAGGGAHTFADLTGWAFDDMGKPQSFLSSEENFKDVKALHDKNLIVPVSGDFGGPKALRAIGAYVQKQGGVVSAYYVSNVEQYLFQDGKDRAFYANVATLPINPATVFIRPYSLRRGSQPLCPIGAFLGAVTSGRVFSNNDALACYR